MNPSPPQRSANRRKRGLALITVLSMLALTTIVVLAFFSLTDTEYKATLTFSASQSAKQYADTALNVVISQIRTASDQDDSYTGREFHATQPGAVRTYTQQGNFLAGYKLFSDANMVYKADGSKAARQEQAFVGESEPPADWREGNNRARYVDLNEPVVRAKPTGTGGAAEADVFFPILDPRAAHDIDPASGNYPVEGFSYTSTTSISNNNLSGGDQLVKTFADSGGDPNNMRLPMPVQWLYMLKDGSLGVLNESDLVFTGVGSDAEPSVENPIVARLAFWTDDETSKVNINTASEPTAMGKPTFFHGRDKSWGDSPAARSEYQRFPGHPATVALSSIFYPRSPFSPTGVFSDQRSLDIHRLSGGQKSTALSIKQRIYDLAPRIHTGGSVGGTVIFVGDEYDSAGSSMNSVAINEALNERLYSSVDELLFSMDAAGAVRDVNDLSTDAGPLFDRTSLQRASGFLTAHSRGSEINLFGLPKISMWPVADESLGGDYRTGFDDMIAYCGTLGTGTGNSYFFRRAKSNSASFDSTQIQRNVQLLKMLQRLMENENFPIAFSGLSGTDTKFSTKYSAENVRQIIVEMFDYIRCTNLMDNLLVPDQSAWPKGNIANNLGVNPNPRWQDLYDLSETGPATSHKTFTPGVAKTNQSGKYSAYADYPLPGSGQVTPAIWPVGGKEYMGFGRNVTISEIGLQFICTADGQNDQYSYIMPIPDPDQEKPIKDGEPIRYLRAPLQQTGAAFNGMDLYGTYRGKGIVVCGGRTAIKVNPSNINSRQLLNQNPPRGFRNVGEGNVPVITNLYAADKNGDNNGNFKERIYSNFPPNPGNTTKNTLGILPANIPGQTTPGDEYYGLSEEVHPAMDSRNWNWTLDSDTPLATNQKRIQAALTFEMFCPSVGYSPVFPEFTIVVDGKAVSGIEITSSAGSTSLFSTTGNLIFKSERNIFYDDQNQAVGGFSGPQRMISNRRAQGRRTLVPDDGFNDNQKNQPGHVALINFDLTSTFHTINSSNYMTFSKSPPIRVDIYDTHDWQSKEPIQTITFELPRGEAPPPELVVHSTFQIDEINLSGARRQHPALQAARWWGFHRDGVMGRLFNNQGLLPAEVDFKGRFYQAGAATPIATRSTGGNTSVAKQKVPGARDIIYAFTEGGNYEGVSQGKAPLQLLPDDPDYRARKIEYTNDDDDPIPQYFGTDVVRTLQPVHGDVRLIAAKRVVPSSDFVPHVFWGDKDVFVAHNFSNYRDTEAGYDFGGEAGVGADAPQLRVIPTASYIFTGLNAGNGNRANSTNRNYVPDAPHRAATATFARRYGDYDDADPGGKIGPYINKPDEGNQRKLLVHFNTNDQKQWRGTYFVTGNVTGASVDMGTQFYSPNRMIPSPVVMGSLPTGVWDSNSGGSWKTLLFRADAPFRSPNGSNHPGADSPPDHYLLDLFWMPVVEPYAISEPLSTAGKVNMNYQMMPFTHIRRATALHAVLKDEKVIAIPNDDYANSRQALRAFNGSANPPRFVDETLSGQDQKYWYRNIVIDEFEGSSDKIGTLKQFDERFDFKYGVNPPAGNIRQGLFRTPSQICEVYLIPEDIPSGASGGASLNVSRARLSTNGVASFSGRKLAMQEFWTAHSVTGENTRERPYGNIYPKLTTKSNTFRVHVRVQTLRKPSRSQAADQFEIPDDLEDSEDPVQEFVTSEYRGSYLLERYVDVRDATTTLPDYAAASDPLSEKPLDSFARFRILESKRFSP